MAGQVIDAATGDRWPIRDYHSSDSALKRDALLPTQQKLLQAFSASYSSRGRSWAISKLVSSASVRKSGFMFPAGEGYQGYLNLKTYKAGRLHRVGYLRDFSGCAERVSTKGIAAAAHYQIS